MNLKEFIEENENEQLDEGLRFFKKSDKLKKYADKIEEKLISAQSAGKIDADKASQVKEVISDARIAAKEFQRLEDKFKNKEIDRSKAKDELKKLKEKHSGLIKKVKKESLQKVMKIIGAAGLLAGMLGVAQALGAPIISSKTTMMRVPSGGPYSLESLHQMTK